MTKKKSRKKRFIILAVVVVIVALGVLGYINMQQNIVQMTRTTYQISEVVRGNVEVKVKGAGTVAPLEDHNVYAGFAATVNQVLAEDGDIVSAGDVIAVFESKTLDSERKSLEQQIEDTDAGILTLRATSGRDSIYSPVKGVVKAVYAQKGDSVDAVMEQYGALAVICPDKRLTTDIAAGNLSLNDKVTVTLEAKSVQGVVQSLADGRAVVGFEDESFDMGAAAVVTSADGAELGAGTVSVENPVYITGRGGVVEKIRKDVNEKVSRGGKLFDLEGEILSAQLYEQIDLRADLEQDLRDVLEDMEALTVYAGTDGVISGLSVNEEQMVQEGALLFTVQSNNAVKIDVEIDELDIAGIALNEMASVKFDALPDQTFDAQIVKINPIGVAQNNVTNFIATLSIDQAANVMIGMSADVEIISQRADDVLIIPVEAIQIINGEKYVVLESDIDESLDATPATHKVTTGITDGVNIVVLTGLSEGDRVAVPQVSKNLQSQMMNFRNNAEDNATS